MLLICAKLVILLEVLQRVCRGPANTVLFVGCMQQKSTQVLMLHRILCSLLGSILCALKPKGRAVVNALSVVNHLTGPNCRDADERLLEFTFWKTLIFSSVFK